MKTYTEFITENDKPIKTKRASEVLQLMDNDYSYEEAVTLVCKKYKVDKKTLEKELEPFI